MQWRGGGDTERAFEGSRLAQALQLGVAKKLLNGQHTCIACGWSGFSSKYHMVSVLSRVTPSIVTGVAPDTTRYGPRKRKAKPFYFFWVLFFWFFCFILRGHTH